MPEKLMENVVNKLRKQCRWHQLPLAVYREIAAHLRQVEGVETGLLPVPPGEPFEYSQSQVGGLWLEYPETITPAEFCFLEQILAYYDYRYGNSQTL